MAGAEIVAAVDAWGPAVATYRVNFPKARAIQTRLSMDTGPEILGLDPGSVDLLIASPECTNHSIAKGNKPRDEESRKSGWFVVEFLRRMGDSAPRWVVLENVTPMRDWDGYDDMIAGLEALGYKWKTAVLDASAFGVPQSRKRLFVVCDRKSEPRLPVPGTATSLTARDILDPFGTWTAGPLHSPRRSENTLARAQAGIDTLGRGVDFIVVYYGSDKAGGWQTLDRPLRTLTTIDRFGLVQWETGEPTLRMLQVPELRRAMGLHPRELQGGGRVEFEFGEGSRRDHVKILGNGVCAPVMEAVIRTLTQAAPVLATDSFPVTIAA